MIKSLWASPLTLFGLAAIWLASRFGADLTRSIRWAPLTRWGRAYHLNPPTKWFRGLTIGEVVVYSGNEVAVQTFLHESCHVRQARRWGIFLPICYTIASIVLLVWGRHWYWDNPFERAARRAAGQDD